MYVIQVNCDTPGCQSHKAIQPTGDECHANSLFRVTERLHRLAVADGWLFFEGKCLCPDCNKSVEKSIGKKARSEQWTK